MAHEPKYSMFFQTPKSEAESEEELRSYKHHKELISSLPFQNGMYLYEGFWFYEICLPGVLSARKHFEASPATDVFLNAFPKSGTTWVRALAFAIINRHHTGTTLNGESFDHHPLLARHPQTCAVFLEGTFAGPQIPDFSIITDTPRLFSSHAPFSLLPESVKTSCRIVYVSREPKDVLISMLHYANDIRPPGTPAYKVDDAVGMFCEGQLPFGPIWEHQMEYRRESLKRPDMVLFLEYEEMKAKPEESVRRLAEFLGQPFTEEEVKRGAVEEMVKLCSIEFLKELDVNKVGDFMKMGEWSAKNSSFFRKGKVGDWKEHLTPETAERMDNISRQKYAAISENGEHKPSFECPLSTKGITAGDRP